jgi:hypothetical protein
MLVEARFTVLKGGVPQGGPYLADASTGSFTVDRNAEFRRTGEITIEVIPTIPPPTLMPVNPGSMLAPFGSEIFIETGILSQVTTPTPATQWVPNGLFVITTSTVDDTGEDCTVTLDLNDRGWTIAQRALKNPYNFPATSSGNFVTEIQTLLNMVWSQQTGVQPLQYNIAPTTAIVPTASYDQGSDPWQAALDMATAIGYELYFDVNGIVTGKPVPNPLTQPITWNFTDVEADIIGLPGTGSGALFGSAYSTPVEVSVVMTRDGIYNDIVIQGTGTANDATYNGDGIETSGSPILAEAADNNPQSPTWVGGALGDVPNFVESSLVTNVGAQPMANSDLQVALSTAWTVTVATPPNPIFDVDDVVTVTRERVGLVNAFVVLDTITHTFTYDDVMNCTGRILTNNNFSGTT